MTDAAKTVLTRYAETGNWGYITPRVDKELATMDGAVMQGFLDDVQPIPYSGPNDMHSDTYHF